MTRRLAGRIVPLALVPLLVMAGSVAVAKDRDEGITNRIEKQRKTLDKIKDEIQEKKKQAERAEKQRESVLQTIQDLDGRLVKSRQQYRDINRKLKQKDREIEELNTRIGELRSDITARKSSILDRLRVQYIQGRFGYLRTLFAAGTSAEFGRRFQYLSAVSRREYELLQEFRADLERLGELERGRMHARNDMLVFKETTEKRLEETRQIRRSKQEVLTRVVHEKEAHERALEELERSAGRVDSLLRELEAKRKAALARPKGRPGGAHPLKGVLPWPVNGQVVSGFGRQKHPTFDTYVEKKGIEIQAEEGSAIRAVMAGTVAYADWLKGYGLVVILDHLNGFFSLYAHASKLLARVGEEVKVGEVIGETGDTGMTGESTLYFELREGADPVDPLAWLVGRS